MDGAQCSMKAAKGGGLQVPTGPLLMVKIYSLSLLVLHETLLAPVPMYGNETMLWKEKERTRISIEQIDNFRGLLGIRMINRVPNA